jgi:hypothetical protein
MVYEKLQLQFILKYCKQTRSQSVTQPAFTVLTHYDFLMPAVSCVCVCESAMRKERETKKSLSREENAVLRRRCRVADTSATDTLTPQALDLLFFTTKSSSSSP